VLLIHGDIDGEEREFLVALGKGAHARHRFQVGYLASGEGAYVPDRRLETAELFKISKLKVIPATPPPPPDPPPWFGIAYSDASWPPIPNEAGH
jgi:hypothetical protein